MQRHGLGRAWWDWRDRVLELTGVSLRDFLKGDGLPRPWFLAPRFGELSAPEAGELFSVVREELVGPELGSQRGEAGLSRAAGIIEGIRPAESLPLLYAMRHVARERGMANWYWPAFQKDVLGGALPVEAVRGRLARLLARLWLDLYEYTGRSLYHPRAGHEVIKWPLAHAGLLAADEERLVSFGEHLIREAAGGEPEADSLVPAEPEEFSAALLGWLDGAGTQGGGGQLASMLASTDGTESTVAELARHWLLHNWRLAADRAGSVTGEPGTRMPRRLGCTLLYDPSSGVRARVPEASFAGDCEVALVWGGEVSPVRSRYLPEEERTRSAPTEVALAAPQWSPDAELVAADERRTLGFPRSPGRGGLAFRTDGRRAASLRPGAEVYVLIHPDRFSETLLGSVFSDWTRMPEPEGWHGWAVLWARVGDPLEHNAPTTGTDRGTQTLDGLEEIEEAAAALGLPGPGGDRTARARLVGGMPATGGRQTAAGPAFSTREPPLVEVTGLWTGELEVAMSGVGEGEREVSRLPLPPPGPRLVELWPEGEPAPAGAYEVLAGESRVAFDLVSEESSGGRSEAPSPAPFPAGALGIELRVEEGGEPVPAAELSRNLLGSGELVVGAWPAANLSIELSSGGWSRTLEAEPDRTGWWRARLGDLGAQAAPPGPLGISVDWRGLVRDGLVLDDGAGVADLEIRVTANGGATVTGCLTGTAGEEGACAALVGESPWAGEIQALDLEPEEDGRFLAFFPRLSEASWFLILTGSVDDPKEDGAPLQTEDLDGATQPQSYPTERLSGYGDEEWSILEPRLAAGSLPPDLENLRDLSSLAEYRTKLKDRPRRRRIWLAGEGALERLAHWEGTGAGLRGAVLSVDAPGHPADAPGLAGPRIHPVRGDGGALRAGGEKAELEFVCPAHSGRPVRGELGVDERGLELRAWEPLGSCARCGMILPKDEFAGHRDPGTGERCDGRSERVFPGGRKRVRVLVEPDLGRLEEAVFETIRLLASDQRATVTAGAEPWRAELRKAYSLEGTGIQPADWLLELYRLPRQVETATSREHRPLGELVALGRRVRRCREGLEVLERWIAAETETGR